MNNNLSKIFQLEQELNTLINDGFNINSVDCENIILSIDSLLKKTSNNDLLYILENGTYIHYVLDITSYFKKYKINKKKIEKDNLYKETFIKLKLFVDSIFEVSLCIDEYDYICRKCYVDDVAKYLLDNMNNVDIMSLANESDDWNYKLFLFENLKKD